MSLQSGRLSFLGIKTREREGIIRRAMRRVPRLFCQLCNYLRILHDLRVQGSSRKIVWVGASRRVVQNMLFTNLRKRAFVTREQASRYLGSSSGSHVEESIRTRAQNREALLCLRCESS